MPVACHKFNDVPGQLSGLLDQVRVVRDFEPLFCSGETDLLFGDRHGGADAKQ